MAFMSVCMDVHIFICTHVHMHICAHKCEMNLKGICPFVHAYMQIGVYIAHFACVCAFFYICVEVYMLIHVIFR